MLPDVDRPEDLHVWETLRGVRIPRLPNLRISVIIPTLNESAHIRDVLACVRVAADVEVIVVDGGSTDSTPEIAAAGARVIQTRACRALQMNRGAAIARGDVLVFLHGDTRLPPHYAARIRETLRDPHTVGGALALGIDAPQWPFRRIETGANLRSRWLRMPYGDQAIFVRRAVFERIGGFPDGPLLEDFRLVRRLRTVGRLRVLPVPVRTSPRRWQRIGPWKATVINRMILPGYGCGMSLDRLARWYRMTDRGHVRTVQPSRQSGPPVA